MSLEQMYNNRRASFITRAADSLIKPNGTPEEIMSDGNSQIVVARQDEPRLTSGGMDPALITDVEELLGAYSWISGLCDTTIAEHNDDKEMYKRVKDRAYKIRKELFRFGKFGCKRNKLDKVLVQLKEIIEGVGDEDLIYDMLKLYQLYTQNPTIAQGLLEFNPTWIPQALELHNQLNKLRAEVQNPDVDSEIATMELEVRQAYDLYHEKLYELRDWGEFVFEGDERARKYLSQYVVRRMNNSKKSKAASDE